MSKMKNIILRENSNDIIYESFTWPPVVAAHDRQSLAGTLHNNGN